MELSKMLILLSMAVLVGTQVVHGSVTYDSKAIIINGERKILFSGSIHYPRSTPEMWDDLVLKSKNAGLDVIDTYVFWNVHEPSPGNYTFEGRYDLVRFIKTVQRHGLYVTLRIGPYVCAEWNFGGFPVWLKFVPGVSFRRYNEPFKAAMQGFTEKIIQMMKEESLFQPQGGPIILSQIENEFGNARRAIGIVGAKYIKWAAQMALGLNTEVPWIMCLQSDAPDPVINTQNGFYSNGFAPNKPYKPTMWTEAWSGWITNFGGTNRQRPVEDIAYAIANFTQSGGSYVNYYMFHGGTNFGRTAGGPFITTSYDYDAPIDEYGLPREPKYSHLKELHKAIKLCEQALVSSDPTVISLGNLQQAHVFSEGQGGCAAFLSNSDSNITAKVMFNNMTYELPPWSISILPDCKNEVFNTAKVRVQIPQTQMLTTNSNIHSWEYYNEDISRLEDNSTFTTVGLLEQINVTKYASDYLWYMTSIDISPSESFLQGGRRPMLTVRSSGHALHVFVNGQFAGSAHGTPSSASFKFVKSLNLHSGTNKIAILSITNGLYAGAFHGQHFETFPLGILGPVIMHGLDQGKWDLSMQKWTYKVGLKGEAIDLFSHGISSVRWTKWSLENQVHQPLIWYKSYFNTPNGNEPLALDMRSMQKGQVWINGENIGRYWTVAANGTCGPCSYAGKYDALKCQLGCERPSQRWYHVPREWLKPTENLLVLFEEIGGDVSKISLVKRHQIV